MFIIFIILFIFFINCSMYISGDGILTFIQWTTVEVHTAQPRFWMLS